MLQKLRALGVAALLALAFMSQAFAQATQTIPALVCFQATTGINGMVGTLGTITGGSGGTTGSYGGVALTGGSGTTATANITVSGGAVTAVSILNPGINYVVGDTLSAASGNIGGVTGFSVPVASISINSSLAGGTVGFYIPSTLTTKQTWQDAGESILNTNPVQLDSNGCALIYGTGTYRQILHDSLGNTIWDQVTTAQLAPSGGSVVTSFNGRTGAVVPQAGDYTSAMITTVSNGAPICNGCIGQLLEVVVPDGSGIPLTTDVQSQIATLALSAGSWSCGGYIALHPAISTVVVEYGGSIGLTSAVSSNDYIHNYDVVPPNNVGQSALPATYFNFSSPTSVYLNGGAEFSVANARMSGRMSCLRVG